MWARGCRRLVGQTQISSREKVIAMIIRTDRQFEKGMERTEEGLILHDNLSQLDIQDSSNASPYPWFDTQWIFSVTMGCAKPWCLSLGKLIGETMDSFKKPCDSPEDGPGIFFKELSRSDCSGKIRSSFQYTSLRTHSWRLGRSPSPMRQPSGYSNETSRMTTSSWYFGVSDGCFVARPSFDRCGH